MSKIVKVSMETVDSNDDLFQYIIARCNFCQKESAMKEIVYKNTIKLGHGYPYCSFCLRNRFNHKKKGCILLMDFRGIFGFYLNYLYDEGSIWYSQILDYIRKHTIIGLQNPVFSYDHESMLWFIDFSRVGNSPHKIPLESVQNTVCSIIDSLQIDKNIKSCNVNKVIEKYSVAIDEYYKTRKRPEGRRVLSPTLINCAYRPNCDWELTKKFVLENQDITVLPIGTNVKEYAQYTEDLTTPLNNDYIVVIRRRKSKGQTIGWEGIVELPGMSKSKITNKDGNTCFEKIASLKNTAKRNAKKLGLKLKIKN